MVELTNDEIRLIDIDISLNEAERVILELQAERREIINRLDINKRERSGKKTFIRDDITI